MMIIFYDGMSFDSNFASFMFNTKIQQITLKILFPLLVNDEFPKITVALGAIHKMCYVFYPRT